MCRLLAYAATEPRTLVSMLGEDGLREFTELSCVHADGWGAARLSDGRLSVDVATEAARDSDRFREVAFAEPSTLCLVHLRWATLGLPVAEANTHPFSDGTVAFAHNGSIEPVEGLEALVDPRHRSLLRGDTDSERYFLALLSRLPEGPPSTGDLVQAYTRTLAAIAASSRYTSLNSMLLTPDHLVVASYYDPAAPALEETPDYFRLHYRVTDESVLVSSSGWGTGWETLTNGHLLVVERGTLATSVHPVEPLPLGQ